MSIKLSAIGWKLFFQQQLSLLNCPSGVPARIAQIHRDQILIWHQGEELKVSANVLSIELCDVAVGDWLYLELGSNRCLHVLERENLLSRKGAGTKLARQLIAANVDTLFVVTSCNQDFNLSRLERYLALAREYQIDPVIILTKGDLLHRENLIDDYIEQCRTLDKSLLIEAVDAREPASLQKLSCWCKEGQTLAVVGSSGVGKSTLANVLTVADQDVGDIREADAKGRHTTTSRSMLRLKQGGVLIDTPGIRELQLVECSEGLNHVFSEIEELSQHCRFSNCHHDSEPGCAIQRAIREGTLQKRRWVNYSKLQTEQQRNSESLAEKHHRDKQLGKLYRSSQSDKRRRRNVEG